MNITQLNKKVKHTYTQKYGGYAIYFRMIFQQLWPLMANQSRLIMIQSSGIMGQLVATIKVLIIWLSTIIKLPWLLLIKPLGCCFKSMTEINGSFSVEYYKPESYLQFSDLKFKSQKVTKTKIFYLMGVPFFMIPQFMTEEDWLKLIKQ